MGFIITFLQSLIYQYLTIKIENRYGFFIDPNTKAHAIHKTPTPRVGGIGIFLAFAVYLTIFFPSYWWLLAGSSVIFGFGLFEDWHGDTPKEYRLMAMALGTMIVIFGGDYIANESGFFTLPYPLAIAFTIFAVVGLSSAINFIDGLNGLAGGMSLITIVFFTLTDYFYGESELLTLLLILGGSLVGFLVWNYPKGKIFLGDGGAYFLGFLLAVFSIMLATKHSEISLWYPLTALAYPVIETFVTIDRRIKRKKKYGTPFFEAEKVHLHTLKFRRRTRDNAAASRRILLFHFYINTVAFIVQQSIPLLILCFLITCIVYKKKYEKLITFRRKQPRWFFNT